QCTDREGPWRGIFLFRHFDPPRSGPSSALELITNHTGPSAHAPLVDRAAMRGIERIENVLGLHMETVHVVEPAIPGLRHNGEAPVKTARIRTALFHSPVHDRVA